jgi:hypothetical protein
MIWLISKSLIHIYFLVLTSLAEFIKFFLFISQAKIFSISIVVGIADFRAMLFAGTMLVVVALLWPCVWRLMYRTSEYTERIVASRKAVINDIESFKSVYSFSSITNSLFKLLIPFLRYSYFLNWINESYLNQINFH